VNGKLHLLLVLPIVLFLSSSTTALASVNQLPDEIHSLDQGGENPPSIEWHHAGVTYHWDGVYYGQTEEVWPSTNWVNDSDGIDTVLYQYKWESSAEVWINRTPILLESNSTHGFYSYNFTQRVWWDWERNVPVIESTWFAFRIFANDTLGNWRTTPAMGYSGGYMVINPPPEFYIIQGLPILMIIGAVLVVSLVIVMRLRKA
jgi:hypothetical protein